MSAAFKVGEIAVMQNCITASNNGRECEVIGPLNHYALLLERGEVVFGYEVGCADGSIFVARPDQLRKKQPPRSAKSIMRAAILKAKQPCEVAA
jgi:hypothetical protein